MSPIITFVVPCYNSEEYMGRCIDSILATADTGIEIVIVNDGSTDGTADIADSYAQAHPDLIRVVHKENGGHGSGINAGLRAATGAYFKVVDSDDWLNESAGRAVLRHLAEVEGRGEHLDLLVTNFVYEKQGKRVKRSVDYARALPEGTVFEWSEVRKFWTWQYLLMHSMTYRTELLRSIELHVPENSFYVDNYFAFVPLPWVRKLSYLNVDLYRYFIGREDQSVNEKVMIGRIDQQININMLMIEHLSKMRNAGALPASLQRYMTRYALLVTAVTSVLLSREGSRPALEKKCAVWRNIKQVDADLYRELRRSTVGYVTSAKGRWSKVAMGAGYHASRVLVGFN